MSYGELFIGLDVGGSTMKAAVVNDDGALLSEPVVMPTEAAKGQEHGLSTMAATIRAAVDAARVTFVKIAAIGVATPGPLDLRNGIMLEPPNLKPWRNVPVRQFLSDEFQKPTAFQNDANAAAFGEWWCGAGRRTPSLVMFTLGTGIGGGIILAGRIVEGEHSHGGELGHIKVELTNARLCCCDQRGCLEAYASATAVVTRASEALAADDQPSMLRQVNDLNAKAIFDAAASGDAIAEQIVDETAKYLAMGAANVMHTIDPEIIVFGGGMALAGNQFLDRIRHYIPQFAFPTPAKACRILLSELGSNAGIIGAAGCALVILSTAKNLASPSRRPPDSSLRSE